MKFSLWILSIWGKLGKTPSQGSSSKKQRQRAENYFGVFSCRHFRESFIFGKFSGSPDLCENPFPSSHPNESLTYPWHLFSKNPIKIPNICTSNPLFSASFKTCEGAFVLFILLLCTYSFVAIDYTFLEAFVCQRDGYCEYITVFMWII